MLGINRDQYKTVKMAWTAERNKVLSLINTQVDSKSVAKNNKMKFNEKFPVKSTGFVTANEVLNNKEPTEAEGSENLSQELSKPCYLNLYAMNVAKKFSSTL